MDREKKGSMETFYYKRKNVLNYLIKPAKEVETICWYYVYLENEHQILLFGILRNFLNSKSYRKILKSCY